MSYVPEILEIIPNPSVGYNNWASSSNFYENTDSTTNGTPTQATGVFALGDKSGNKYGALALSYGIKYESGIWYDNGSNEPYSLSNTSSYATSLLVADAEYIYVWYNSGDCLGRFLSPYFGLPPPNTNSNSDVFVSYVVEDNELRVYIPLDKPSTVHPNPDPAGRDLYYQLRKVSGTSFFVRIVHTQGTSTNETIVPTTAGIYQFEKVQTNPTVYTTYDTAEVSQAQLDFYAANNPPDDDPPDDDPPPTPVFVPRSARRGNLNFW